MKANKDQIKRFVSGKFSFNDYLSVVSFFEDEKNDKSLKEYLNNDWEQTSQSVGDKQKLNKVLDKIHYQIGLRNEKLAVKIYRTFSRLAVILIVPALFTIAVLSYFSLSDTSRESWVEVHAPLGTRTRFHLPDGSEGWLNSGSSIRYPVAFEKNRDVEISGEAWFDVVHKNSERFKVHTPYFDVTVLGTQFNVVAYENEEIAEVILERGKVLVEGKNEKFRSELLPDQELKYNKLTKRVIKKEIDSKLYTSWINGQLIFKNTPMSEIAQRLERKYNVEIDLHGDSLKTSVFRATFEDESIEDIMDMLATVAPIKYKIHKRQKQSDNTFAKRKIEIWF